MNMLENMMKIKKFMTSKGKQQILSYNFKANSVKIVDPLEKLINQSLHFKSKKMINNLKKSIFFNILKFLMKTS